MRAHFMVSFVAAAVLGCGASPSPSPETAMATPPVPAPEPARMAEPEPSFTPTPAARTQPRAEPEPTAPPAGDEATLLAMCPMRVDDAGLRTENAPDGIALVFTTFRGSMEDLRQRARTWVDMHNQHATLGASSGMRLVDMSSTASVEDVPNGVRILILPRNGADLTTLRARVTALADAMRRSGSCPMMSTSGTSPSLAEPPRTEPAQPVQRP